MIAAGIAPERIFMDKMGGVKTSRPGLDAVLSDLRSGESLTVVSLDRLGRSTLHLLQAIHDLIERGVTIYLLKQGEDLGTTNGKLMVAIFSALAECECALIDERAAKGRAAREKRGTAAARPKTVFSAANIDEVRQLHADGLSAADIVDHKTIRRSKPPMSRSSVYSSESHPRAAPRMRYMAFPRIRPMVKTSA